MKRGLLTIPLLALFLLAFAQPAGASAAGCPDGLVCTDVSVPLDRNGATPGNIDIPVVSQPGDEPLLILLGGGPGQGMTQNAESFIPYFSSLAPGYRVAVIDQRGTGKAALRCPALQFADLTDLTPPPPGSVEACGRKLGFARSLYTTGATVADLDAIRQAMGVDKLSLFGISYGSYVAERYARAHPAHTGRLVLNSIVPQENVEPFFTPGMRRFAVVLRQLCHLGVCKGITRDPVGDLARLVRKVDRKAISGTVRIKTPALREKVRIDGPALYDMSVTLASFDTRNLVPFVRGIKDALAGKSKSLLKLALEVKAESATSSYPSLSWGLHTATLCGDIDNWPWGGANAPATGRHKKAVKAAGKLPTSRFAPFDRKTAVGNGALVTCQRWQRTKVDPPPLPGPLPKVPTLMIAGGWDLSTPVSDARMEARRSKTEKLVVIPRAGHAAAGFIPCTAPLLRHFFTDKPLGTPCAGYRPEL